MRDELVAENDLQEQRQQNHHQQLRQVNQVQLDEVVCNFKSEEPAQNLRHYAANQHDGAKYRQHQAQRKKFADKVRPVAQRQRIVDLVEAHITFAPDQLARIQRPDNDQKQAGL